jgi:hypothetical protein
MRHFLARITTAALCLAPIAAFAHPGHADGMPILHAMSHTVHYVVALIAIGIWSAKGVDRALRASRERKRSNS